MRFEVVLPLCVIVSSFAYLLPVSIACDAILSLLSTCPIPMITLAYTLVVCITFGLPISLIFLGMNLVFRCGLLAFISIQLMFLFVFFRRLKNFMPQLVNYGILGAFITFGCLGTC
jgi:hypothetical protein